MKVFIYLLWLIFTLFLTSCFSITYHKRRFKNFDPVQSQNHLVEKNGYYFYEAEGFKSTEWLPNDTGGVSPTDSVFTKFVTGILFYNNSRVHVIPNYFNGLGNDQENSLEIAQKKLEKEIEQHNLYDLAKINTKHSTLGKYAIHNDTIIIQYFRFSFGNRYLTELRGTLKNNKSFDLFERTDFYNSWFSKAKPEIINKRYIFKKHIVQ